MRISITQNNLSYLVSLFPEVFLKEYSGVFNKDYNDGNYFYRDDKILEKIFEKKSYKVPINKFGDIKYEGQYLILTLKEDLHKNLLEKIKNFDQALCLLETKGYSQGEYIYLKFVESEDEKAAKKIWNAEFVKRIKKLFS